MGGINLGRTSRIFLIICSMVIFMGFYSFPFLSTKRSTTLSIIESCAIIGTEDICYLKAVNLTAVLKDAEGKPLHGKSIIWHATLGTFEPSVESVTDAFGEALIIYKPPRVDTGTPVTITARFTGDEKYEGSSAAIERILLPRLIPLGSPPPLELLK